MSQVFKGFLGHSQGRRGQQLLAHPLIRSVQNSSKIQFIVKRMIKITQIHNSNPNRIPLLGYNKDLVNEQNGIVITSSSTTTPTPTFQQRMNADLFPLSIGKSSNKLSETNQTKPLALQIGTRHNPTPSAPPHPSSSPAPACWLTICPSPPTNSPQSTILLIH